jgi:hypothetical protein
MGVVRRARPGAPPTDALESTFADHTLPFPLWPADAAANEAWPLDHSVADHRKKFQR